MGEPYILSNRTKMNEPADNIIRFKNQNYDEIRRHFLSFPRPSTPISNVGKLREADALFKDPEFSTSIENL